jgi:hypothetical protein
LQVNNLYSLIKRFFNYKGNNFCTKDNFIKTTMNNLWQVNSWEIKEKFFYNYINSKKMKEVDAFLCSLPPAICQYYMGFNKTMIVLLPVSFLFSRGNKKLI